MSWLYRGVRFTANDLHGKSGIQWAAYEIGAVIDSLNQVSDFLGVISMSNGQEYSALGLAGPGLLTFNRVRPNSLHDPDDKHAYEFDGGLTFTDTNTVDLYFVET